MFFVGAPLSTMDEVTMVDSWWPCELKVKIQNLIVAHHIFKNIYDLILALETYDWSIECKLRWLSHIPIRRPKFTTPLIVNATCKLYVEYLVERGLGVPSITKWKYRSFKHKVHLHVVDKCIWLQSLCLLLVQFIQWQQMIHGLQCRVTTSILVLCNHPM